MKDYSDLGLTNRLRKDTIKPREFTSVLEDSIQRESSPYLPRTSVSNRGGTIQSNLGGIFEVRDTTGGTVLLTIDPDTGTVTIRGDLQANTTLNLGTINNTVIAGAGTIRGTIANERLINNGTWNNGTMGTPAITGGTINNAVFGTQDSTGGTIRSAVLNNSTIGTQNATGGTINSVIMGTPDITGGTMDNATFGTPNTQSGTLGTPTIIRPTIDGTVNFDTSSGSAALGASGDFAIQTHTGSAILVVRLNGTTFYFTSAGTLA